MSSVKQSPQTTQRLFAVQNDMNTPRPSITAATRVENKRWHQNIVDRWDPRLSENAFSTEIAAPKNAVTAIDTNSVKSIPPHNSPI